MDKSIESVTWGGIARLRSGQVVRLAEMFDAQGEPTKDMASAAAASAVNSAGRWIAIAMFADHGLTAH